MIYSYTFTKSTKTIFASILCNTSLILCSMNHDTTTIQSLITKCTSLMRSVSKEKPTPDDPTWATLFEIITLLEARIASGELPQEMVQTVSHSIASIKSVYASHLQIHSQAAKSKR